MQNNWYKKAEYEDIPEWDYPGAEHDYDPAWDYDIDTDTDKQIVNYVESYINDLKSNLLPKIGFIQNIKIGYIKREDDAIALYINGTQPWAVILINIEGTKEAIQQYGGRIEDAIEMSIVHEIGHAIQEGMDLEFDEEQAEEFAFQYQVKGLINNFWDDNNESV
jgi:hypothetical protein